MGQRAPNYGQFNDGAIDLTQGIKLMWESGFAIIF